MKYFLLGLLAIAQLLAGSTKLPNKKQVIASCEVTLSVQERVALQRARTRLEAAQILQSVYQDRFEKVAPLYATMCQISEEHTARDYEESTGRYFLDDFGTISHDYIHAKLRLQVANDLVKKLEKVDKQ